MSVESESVAVEKTSLPSVFERTGKFTLPRLPLSGTGIGFLGLSVLLYLASMQTTTGLLFLILGILFSCFIYNLIVARRSAAALEIHPPANLCGTENERLRGSWKVRNKGKQTAGMAELRGGPGVLLRIGLISPGSEVLLRSSLKLPQRGIYSCKDLRVESTFPFGLLRSSRPFQIRGEIVVYPAVYPCEPPPAGGFVPMLGGRITGHYQASSGDRFRGVRPFQDRDPMRLIHWPSSSKGLGLMVKEFDEELAGRVLLVVEGGKGRAPDGEWVLDHAARAAASLALAALDAGHQVVLAEPATGKLADVSPFADTSAVLAALAGIRARNGLFPQEALQALLEEQAATKAAVSLILTEVPVALLDWLETTPPFSRRLPTLYLPAHCPISGYTGLVRYYGADKLSAEPRQQEDGAEC